MLWTFISKTALNCSATFENDHSKVRNLCKIKMALFHIYPFNFNFVTLNYERRFKKKLYSTVKFLRLETLITPSNSHCHFAQGFVSFLLTFSLYLKTAFSVKM